MLQMNNSILTTSDVRNTLESKLSRYFGVTPQEADKNQIYKAAVLTVKDILTSKRSKYKEKIKKQRAKTVYYLCMEFLVGRSLKNNLHNLGIVSEYEKVLNEMGFDLNELYELEPDPGLGNGGLGRLASCFMDSLSSLDYPAKGFSICYEYGLFKQKIIDGNQVEFPDDWMNDGDGWLVPRTDKTFSVKFDGHVSEKWENGKCTVIHEEYSEVQAVPYDMMISGSDSEAVNSLRLWRAKEISNFNMNLFSQGQYVRAIQENSNAEIISKVLYPSDDHTEGKLLRLSQQYFLVSASLQNIISDHLASYGTLYNFSDKVAIHINDTHPALCIPELMRILMDIYSYSWENAWDVVTKVVSYTNHTVLPEALECWNVDLFRLKLPRIYNIVSEINRRLCEDLWTMYPGDWDRISRMAIIGYSQVKMANLSIAASHTVNGVSKLHSDILKKTVFRDYYKAMPYKFTNVTNGIAHRRWLSWSNPKLSKLLDECIGEEYKKKPETLTEFNKFRDDTSVLERLQEIKTENKLALSKFIFNKTGIIADVNSIFDVQVKRMHEYKRQLLNALKIISMYIELKENPNAHIHPCTFIFGGKAAPGYYKAKEIIKLIWSLGSEIERDPKIRDIIRVIYLEDYNVSTAEILMPASEISEQISLAGKEASGTGCMKFMINGALTLGTLDGANVEMKEAVNDDSIYIFGHTAEEVDELWKKGYEAIRYYQASDKLRKTVDRLHRGFNGTSFSNLVSYLISGYGVSDPYMCLADFDSYIHTFNELTSVYQNKELWAKKSLRNIAQAGYFAADRSIGEYAADIWHINHVK
ncbi:glycogen phosphorylase [Holotrichia oblita]|nr:glycogen phosphorylase [Holotrichia oblita]